MVSKRRDFATYLIVYLVGVSHTNTHNDIHIALVIVVNEDCYMCESEHPGNMGMCMFTRIHVVKLVDAVGLNGVVSLIVS